MRKRSHRLIALLTALAMLLPAYAAAAALPTVTAVYDSDSAGYTLTAANLEPGRRYTVYALKPGTKTLTGDNILYISTATAAAEGTITLTGVVFREDTGADLCVAGAGNQDWGDKVRVAKAAVTLPSGKPLEGMTAILTKGGSAVTTGTTGADGTVAFRCLTPGTTYSLEVSGAGCESLTREITVPENADPATVTVTLKKFLPETLTITGTGAMGEPLTASLDGLTLDADYTLQWYYVTAAEGTEPTLTPIANATSATYTPVAADAGKTVTAAATGIGDYQGAFTAEGVDIPLIPLTGPVTITGTVGVGKPLTAKLDGLTLNTDYTLQWYYVTTAEGAEPILTPIANATSTTFTPVAADGGKTVTVTATGMGAYQGTLTAAAVAVPVPEPTPPSPGPSGGTTGGGVSAPEPAPEVEVDEKTDTAQVKLEAEVDRKGTAAVTVDTETAKALAETETGTAVLTPVVDKTAQAVSVELSKKAAAALETIPRVKVETPAAAVTVTGSALAGLKGDVALTTQVEQDGAVTISLAANGKEVETVSGGLAVTLPQEKSDPGAVAVLVKEDGAREVLPKSVLTDEGMVFVLTGSATVKVENQAVQFHDMEAHWAADSVAFTSARNLFQGTSEGVFAPELRMSRAMVVTVLYRLEQEPEAASAHFTDVTDTAWYADAVAWGAQTGVVQGDGERFDPDTPVTREQLCAMLFRCAQSAGRATEKTHGLTAFADAGQVSPWATECMAWAVETGLMTGRKTGTGNLLAAGDSATRAEVAVIMERFTNYLVVGGTD